MADFTLSKSLLAENIAMPLQRLAILPMRCLAVLLLGWGAIAEPISACARRYERLMQVQETGRPRVEIGLVSAPFLG